MIGIFVRNESGDVGFARPLSCVRVRIAGFHYAADMRVMTVTDAGGQEETFTSEIAPELHSAFLSATQVLVADIDDVTGEPMNEYWVDLTVSGKNR